MTDLWTYKMAWRDSRSNRRKLFLYMAAIIVGVAAQVAITSFRDNLNRSIADQAKELLGADLEVEHTAPLAPELTSYLDSISTDHTDQIGFASMAYFPASGMTRLSQITATEAGFPFYGDLITEPADAATRFLTEQGALVDQAVLNQLELSPGDTVKVGLLSYPITGGIVEIPGQAAATAFFGPRILIPIERIEETGLLERGSRLEYKRYVKYTDGTDPLVVDETLDAMNDSLSFRYDDVAERQEEVGEAITQLSNFLNLIGFIALLLGGIGVASSIFVYIRQKIKTIAVLRCIGTSSSQAMNIYLVQALGMGLFGSLLGAIMGTLIQLYLPVLVGDFVPVDIELAISWPSVLTGLGTGLIISLLFSLFPLLAVQNISPLHTLRSVQVDLSGLLTTGTKVIMSVLTLLFVTAYAWWMLDDLRGAAFFTLGFSVSLLILAGIAVLVMKAARRFVPSGLNYEWRQGLANLYRPNNQTTTLLLTFGLGVTMISSLYLTQDMLLSTINFDNRNEGELPNLALFDIQYDQNEGVNRIIRENGLEIQQNVPIVTMKLSAINDRTVSEILADTSRNARRWALNREYRSTYRDSLVATETLSSGTFTPSVDGMGDPVPVSLSDDIMKDLNVSLGDTLVWDVQGIPITTYIGSTRTIEWDTPQPNFFAVFPKGVLEPAPQFFATTLRTPDKETSLNIQRDIVKEFPNVSAIDVGQIISTLRDFLDRITFVIQFIGLFSVITGLIVLAGSASTSRFQRIRETVLLRTLGARKRQVIRIQIIEYVMLGLIASLIGLSLSVGSSYVLTIFYFEIDFTPSWSVIGIEVLVLTGLILGIGSLNTRGIHDRPPLEILRAEDR